MEKGAGQGLNPDPWFHCNTYDRICFMAWIVGVRALQYIAILHCIYMYSIVANYIKKMCAGFGNFNLWLMHVYNPWLYVLIHVTVIFSAGTVFKPFGR